MRIPRIAPSAAIVLSVSLLSGCYELSQGGAFLAMLARAEPVSRLLASSDLPEARRAFLERVAAIRSFGVEELGLKDTKNYTRLVEAGSDRAATVVQACAELSFDRYLWSYPVVGKLPYKGFFDPADAEKERKRLKAAGYDVIVRGVDSFSTLGWFADPLYSFMQDYGEGELAELLLHEMTHATAFSKAPGSFNEELASFVGRAGAESWLARRFGAGSAELASFAARRKESAAFSAFLAETSSELSAAYASSAGDEEKRAEKKRIIAARAELYRTGPAKRFTAASYRDFPMEKANNAFLDLYALYEGEPALYADYLRAVCGGDLRRFIADAVRAAKSAGDPKAAFRDALAAADAAPMRGPGRSFGEASSRSAVSGP